MADFGTSMAAQLAATAVTMAVQRISEVMALGDDVQKLRKKLIELHALFMDTERAFCKHESRSMKLWIRDLQDAALDAEDDVELYAAVRLSGSIAIHSSSYFSFGLFKGLFAKYFRKLKSFSELNSLRSEIRRINQTFYSLEERTGSILALHRIAIEDLRASDSVLLSDMNAWKNSENIFEESTSVDVDYKVENIVSLIQQHKAVAVVGMGGSGKTRLLQHVYKSLSLKIKYEECIWLCVSQIYSIKQLQLDVLYKLKIPHQERSVSALQSTIYDELREKDCLVVLDDVWDLPETEKRQGANVAEKLRSIGFPIDGNRCSVLISTRDHKVAEQFGSYPYAMPLLPDDKSYDLLCKRLLPHPEFGEMVFTEAQDELIKKILKKCGGLPLAIVVLAGIMKHQHPDQWQSTLKDMEMLTSASSSSASLVTASTSEVPQSAVIIALRLSFNALEFKVKPCFAFLGVFAEDEEIESEKLIGMWLAEGFVESEEEGLLMLKHLSNRCLLNMKHPEASLVVAPTSRTYNITVHDLVHDLAMTVYKENGGVCQGSSSDEAFARELQRERRLLRIDIGNSNLNCIPSTFRCPRSVRLLRFSYSNELSHIPEETLANAGALRTLDMCNRTSFHAKLTCLPKCVAQLRILKFLNMSGSSIRRLPRCLRQLKHLQYLYTSIVGEVPAWVEELQSLTHFSSSSHDCEWKKVNANQIMPRSLKVVRGIDIEIGGGRRTRKKKKKTWTWTWEDVAQLSELQQVEVELQVHNNNIESGVLPPHTLEWLSMRLKGGSATVTIPHEWALHLHKLEVLHLGSGVEFPRQAGGFFKLHWLQLSGDCEEYHPDICKLPQLRHLTLLFNNKCKSLPHEFGSAEAFPKLLTLGLYGLPELCMLPAIEDGAMPCLTKMILNSCEKLSTAGSGWEDKIHTLEEVHIGNIDPALETQLRNVI